jgi:cytochrome b involved in lipid metabolism
MYYHPGGFDRIEPYLGKNIDRVFKSVGHSEAALKIIAQLPRVGMVQGA